VDSAIEGFPPLVGGLLCLDFVNTVDDRLDARPVDWLSSYGALLAWSRHSGALRAEEEARLALLTPSDGHAALARATEVREALYAVLAALAVHKSAPPAALAIANRALADLMGAPVLRPEGSGLQVAMTGEASLDADTPLRRVLRSVIDLLADGRAHLVRQCAAPDCSFLFLDTTKSHNRLWCRSGGCGTRNRFRRYYARQRERTSTR
jgi:predicted RNA-binding Zn ribbon-like protein